MMNSKKTILLVEDDPDDQDFFITAIKEISDATIFEIVSNGKEALECLRRAVILPTLIFMDVDMPVMNGIECLREIANDPVINGVPVVMLSSSGIYREQVRELGATAFIKKPNSTEKLRVELEQMLRVDLMI